jgi:hypothetical protein
VVAENTLAQRIKNGMKLSEADFAVRPRVSDRGTFKVVDPRGGLVAVLEESAATGSYNYCCVFSA